MFSQSKFMEMVRRLIPKKIYHVMVSAYLSMIKYPYLIIYSGNRVKCPFCKHSFRKFLPDGWKLPVAKHIIGGGYRKNVICPFCRSTDRERLVYLYLKKNNLVGRKLRLLHVAPEKNLQEFLKNRTRYTSVDLDSPRAKVKMDITDIRYPDNTFDAVICNHVLEHVPDDKKAMQELRRVLKPGGWAIIQVPLSSKLAKTLEKPSVKSPEQRKKVYGQADHVRLYGRDYRKRLEEAGFGVSLKHISNPKFGLNEQEKIYFCKS